MGVSGGGVLPTRYCVRDLEPPGRTPVHRYGVFPRSTGATVRVTGGLDRACELVRGGRVGSQWQRTGRPSRYGYRGGGGAAAAVAAAAPSPSSCTHAAAAAAHRSPVGSTNLTRWPAGQFTPIWDRGRQVSERSKIRNDRRRRRRRAIIVVNHIRAWENYNNILLYVTY